MFKIYYGNSPRHDAVEEPDFRVREGALGLREKRIFHFFLIKQAIPVQFPIIDVHFTAAIAGDIKIHL